MRCRGIRRDNAKGPPATAPFRLQLRTAWTISSDCATRRSTRSARAGTPDALEAIRVAALGRKGRVTELMRGLGALAPEARREAGAALNRLKDEIAAALARPPRGSAGAALAARLAGERVDVTLPVRAGDATGRIHPISQTIDEIVAIFGEMGFGVAEGPHIEEDFYNFTALNIPPEHPARQEHDTFYLPERAGRQSRSCCAPTPRRCRSARCWRRSRRSASSCRAAPSAATTTRPIRRCSTRSRGW